MYTAQRRTTGCWTCRLRRKKCDEGGPPCSNCDSRGVFCHGYGPKPSWKDRGEKEKEEASRLKLQFRKRVSRSIARHSTSSHQSSESNNSIELSTTDVQSPLPADCTLSALSCSQEKQSFDFLDNLEIGDGVWDTATFSNDLWPTTDSSEIVPGPTDLQITSANPSEQTLFFPLMNEPQAVNSAESAPAIGERDIELTMFFVDETFALQHPSYRNASTMQRSWILFLLVRSPTFYYASLSTSAYHHYLTLSGDNEARAIAHQDYQKYRASALRGFYELLDSDWRSVPSPGSLTVLGECMICGMQIALLEALGQNMQDCQSHLSSAAQSLLSNNDLMYTQNLPLTKERKSSISQQLMTPSATPSTASPEISAMERKALTFFRTLLVWNDILSSATQTDVPLGADAYRKLLENEDSDQAFRETIGCESWILTMVMDVTLLEIWKKEQDSQGNLSVRELVTRAEKIEAVLEQAIVRLSTKFEGNSPTSDTIRCQKNDDHHLQTYIFAHSILIYVNTVVSGPSPGVPEIHKSLERAITAWKIDPGLISLKTLAWPYCVSASLATGSQRDIFRDLISRASSSEPALGNLLSIKTVVEECWRSFDKRVSDRDVSCNWKEVMQRLNLRILYA